MARARAHAHSTVPRSFPRNIWTTKCTDLNSSHEPPGTCSLAFSDSYTLWQPPPSFLARFGNLHLRFRSQLYTLWQPPPSFSATFSATVRSAPARSFSATDIRTLATRLHFRRRLYAVHEMQARVRLVRRARATLCGDRARRVREMQARVRCNLCARKALRRLCLSSTTLVRGAICGAGS